MKSGYVIQSLPPPHHAYIVSIVVCLAGHSLSACFYMHMLNPVKSSVTTVRCVASLQGGKLQGALHTIDTTQLATRLENAAYLARSSETLCSVLTY